MKNTSFRTGHILIKIGTEGALKQAVDNFKQARFRVAPGMKNAGNYKIFFSDSSFLELFSIPQSKILTSLAKQGRKMGISLAGRLENYLGSPIGFCDFALDSSPLSYYEENIRILEQRGLTLKRQSMARKTMDGIRTSWTIRYPADPRLPFIMGPYSPPIPLEQSDVQHQNGAEFVSLLEIETSHYEEDLKFYETLLNYQTPLENDSENGKRSSSFKAEKLTIILRESSRNGIKKIVLSGKNIASPQMLDRQLTSNAAILLEPSKE